jgi:hypothetical protein
MLIAYGERLSVPRPSPMLEDYHLFATHNCLLSMFPATLYSWRPFHMESEDAPCHGDKGLTKDIQSLC